MMCAEKISWQSLTSHIVPEVGGGGDKKDEKEITASACVKRATKVSIRRKQKVSKER